MKKKITVLVLDDDPSLLAILACAAQDNFPEATFRQVYSTAQAITYINEVGGRLPTFIFVSIESTDTISGFNFLAFLKVRPQFLSIPVVMLSAASSEEDMLDADEFGATSCILKPHNAREWGQYFAELRFHFYAPYTFALPSDSQSI